uniref:Ig-like domain-containing protein n=1 Tax=Pundamilia nyererei TaxID=303518 RepID=A0A3B4EWP1_9CICH
MIAGTNIFFLLIDFTFCSSAAPLSSLHPVNDNSSHFNVTLTCRAPNNSIIIVLEWSRADLGDEYVLFYRNKQFDPDGQHPSFKNRVDLQDRQMKDGDVSLILNNVTTNDNGTYECRVKTGTNHRKRAILNDNPISIVTLSVVVPPGEREAFQHIPQFPKLYRYCVDTVLLFVSILTPAGP